MIFRRTILCVSALSLLAGPAFGQASEQPPVSVGSQPPLPGAGNGQYQPRDRDERGLWMQMEEAERTLKNSPLVMRDPEINSYVRGVLCRTIGNTKCSQVRIYIMRTPEFNASMAPNGVLLIYSGLLLRTQNEAQLAAVLGHEYTHFENLHSIRLFRDAKSKSAAAAWLALTGVGLIASIGLAASMYKFSREMEREADLGGLTKMATAGYDTRQASIIWEHLREEMDATATARNTKSRKDRNDGMFGSHPPSAERVAYLQEEALRQPGNPSETGSDRFRAAMAPFWPAFVDDQIKLNDFGASEYLLNSLASDGWSAWMLYARGELYRHRAGAGDIAKSAELYGKGIDEDQSLAELWRGRGLARIKLGETESGKSDLSEYLRRAPDAPDKPIIAMLAGVK